MSVVEIRDATPQELHGAIGRVLRGCNFAAAGRQDQAEYFLKYLGAQGLAIDWCLVVADGPALLGSCLGIESPGRVAMVMVSPCSCGEDLCKCMSQALNELTSRAERRGIQIVQSLLPAEARSEKLALEGSGFKYLADLRYFVREVIPEPTAATSWDHLELACYDECDAGAFRNTLRRTYEGSLDCPGLSDLRNIEDILASHRATGLHDPGLWFLARQDGHPVGVLLLTRVPLRSTLEIVYVGVVPESRGRGFGKCLVDFAIAQTRLAHCNQLMLAVDHLNRFALELYRSRGFIETDRRHAWILSLAELSH